MSETLASRNRDSVGSLTGTPTSDRLGAAGSDQPGERSFDDRWGGLAIRLIVGVIATCHVVLALLPERLLLRLTIDDAFYYVRVTQNIIGGNGSSFDAINPTNGYHPLWMILISPITTFIPDGTGQVRVLVLFQGAIAVTAVLMFVRLLRGRIGAIPTALGLVIWRFNPASTATSISGLETSLACLAVLGTVCAAVSYVDEPTRRRAALLGLWAGVAFLARSDSVFASAAVAVWVLMSVRPRGREQTWPVRDIGAAVATAGIVASPWLIWSLARFGTIQQASAGARPMVVWDMMERSGRTGSGTASHLWAATRAGEKFLTGRGLSVLAWTPTVAALLAIGCVWVLLRRTPTAESRRLAVLGAVLVAGGTALAIVHSAVRLVPREYYFEWIRMSLGLMVAALAAWAIGELVTGGISATGVTGRTDPQVPAGGDGLRVQKAAMGAIAVMVALGAITTTWFVRDPAYAWQTNMVEAGKWLGNHSAEDDVVLSFNAGIIAYYSGRQVINLDGVINNSAMKALEDRDLAAYMCASGARWYADFMPVMFEEHQSFLGKDADRIRLEPVRTIHGTPKTNYGKSELTIYKFSCAP